MAPASHCYKRVPVNDHQEKMALEDKLWRWPVRLLLLVAAGLLVAVIVLAVRVNSKACLDGLQAQKECENATHLLEHRLSQAKEVLKETEDRAATCNQTVATLRASLEVEKSQGHQYLEQVKTLQGEIKDLKQELQKKSAELEQLRKKNEASDPGSGSTSSAVSPSVWAPTLGLCLIFRFLLP